MIFLLFFCVCFAFGFRFSVFRIEYYRFANGQMAAARAVAAAHLRAAWHGVWHPIVCTIRFIWHFTLLAPEKFALLKHSAPLL